ncbi:MAG: cupin domain-containing protein [Gaiellaceae bacterium]
MAALEVKPVSSPDEVRQFTDGKGHADVLQLQGQPVLFGTFEPGWRWSEHVKPMAKTDSCQATHLMYCVSGRMRVRMDDGAEQEIQPGDVAAIPPGHDAWVVGDEACIAVDWGGAANYAKA